MLLILRFELNDLFKYNPKLLRCLLTYNKYLKVSPTRKLYEKIINDKHEDAMAKFGAVLGQGIIDAGIYLISKLYNNIFVFYSFFFYF